MSQSSSWFDRFARRCAWLIGHPRTLALVVITQLVWLAVGPFVGFSEAWHDWNVTPLTVFTALALMPLQYSESRNTARIIGAVEEIAEDLPEVDDRRARDRAKEEEKP